MTDDIAHLTIAELSRRIRGRELSPVALVERCLARIDALDGDLNAFNALRPEAALAEARAAETAIAAGEWRGPLHGIPVGIKDMIDVAGLPTTAQAAHRRDAVAARDAGVVRALKSAGAIVLGKQSMPEYAVGIFDDETPWPAPRNPWNLGYDPGGSSAGAAIAAAAGLCPGSVGTETAGSIRDPAAWCGVAGLKPTDGLVATSGVLPLSRTMDCLGPLAWTVEDCALMLAAMVSDEARDLCRPGFRAPDLSVLDAGAAGLRVGVVRRYFEGDPDVDAAVGDATEAALAVLAGLGARLSTAVIPEFAECARVARSITWPEETAEHGAELAAHPDRFGRVTRARLLDGAQVPAPVYIEALRRREALTAELARAMRDVDVLVLPTTKKPAQPLGWEATAMGEVELSLTRPFNLTGSPALSLCSGFTAEGLPLALQIVGRPFEDGTVLRAGHALERALGLRGRRPPCRA